MYLDGHVSRNTALGLAAETDKQQSDANVTDLGEE